ncbi:DNA polymerase III subunit beta [Patescibacteria group bacterium]|nr:DNA polymerase III subunit beta [Patescibacteria group bacterium]
MKLIILKTNLLEALGSIERAIGENLNLPILKNFLIKALDGKITFMSTNLEIAVQHETSGKVIDEGEAAVPFSVFNSVVRNLSAERVTIEKKGTKILISSDNYEGFIQDEDPKEFPIIPKISNLNKSLKIRTEILKDALKNTSVSVQYSTIRPEISGVYVNKSDEGLIFVGTDSFRLTEIKVLSSAFSSETGDFSIIIPIKTVQEVVKMFNGADELSVFVDSNQVLFETEKEKIISRIIDGNFPDYKAVIPKSFKTEVSLEKDEFLNAIRLVSTFSGKANDVNLKSGEGGKFLEIFSSDSSLGEGRYKVPAKIKGEDFSVIFNWRYLLDGLKIYKNQNIDLGVNSSDKPAQIQDQKDKGVSYVVMPIKG